MVVESEEEKEAFFFCFLSFLLCSLIVCSLPGGALFFLFILKKLSVCRF